jgi:hypothetical protein
VDFVFTQLPAQGKELSGATDEFEKEAQLASPGAKESARGDFVRHQLPCQRRWVEQVSGKPVLTTNITLHRNEKFCGREDLLMQLHSYLKRGIKSLPDFTSSSASCLVHAMGGMGKTEVALEYSYYFRNSYTHIFWIRAESIEVITRSYVEMFDKLGLGQQGRDLVRPQKVQQALEWLQCTGECNLTWFYHLKQLHTCWPGWAVCLLRPTNDCHVLSSTSFSPTHLQITSYSTNETTR